MRPTKVYKFGNFKLNPLERLLLRDNQPIPLTPKAFEILVALVSRSGHLVEKDELLKEVWPDTFVEESNLSRIIYLLRKALEGDSSESQFIETVPRRGYRFTAPVEETTADDSGSDLFVRQQRTRAHIIIEEEVEPLSQSVEQKGHAFGEAEKTRNLPAARTSPIKLRRVMLAVLVAAMVATGAFVFVKTRNDQSVGPPVQTIAVLPFKQLGTGNENELLGLGMADAIIIKLTASHLFSVLPTSTVYGYTKRDYNPFAAGKELGVDAVLDGTVQRSDNRIRVTAQLIDIRNGQTIWSEKFDSENTDIFKLQDSISEQLAATLSREISETQRAQLKKWSTANREAYQAYLMGIYFYNQRTEEGLNKAVNYFEEAIKLDPKYARAYAGLSESLHLTVYYGYKSSTQNESLVKAREAALKALELDPRLAEAQLAYGNSQLAYERNTEAALVSYQKALELNPSFATAYQRYSWLLLGLGRGDEALQAMRRAQELDPLSKTNNGALAQVLIYTRHYDEAVTYARRSVELDPNYDLTKLILGDAYLGKRMYEEALTQYRSLLESHTQRTSALESIAYIEAMTNSAEEARKLLAQLLNDPDLKKDSSPLSIVAIYDALGQREQAFKLLEEAGERRSLSVVGLMYDLRLDGIRSDPRFGKFFDSYLIKLNSDDRIMSMNR